MSDEEQEFESTQPKRLPASLRNKKIKGSDERIRPSRKLSDDEDDENEREGGYWKGDKYIPK